MSCGPFPQRSWIICLAGANRILANAAEAWQVQSIGAYSLGPSHCGKRQRKRMQSRGRLTWGYRKNCFTISNCMQWLFYYTKWVAPLKRVRLLLIIMIIIIKERSYSVAQACLSLVSNSWWSSTLSISQVLELQSWASTLNYLVFEIGCCIV